MKSPESDSEIIRVLLVEHDDVDAQRVMVGLSECSDSGIHAVVRALSLADALVKLHDGSFDVILTDAALPDGYGLDAVKRLQKAATDLAIVVLTGVADPQGVVDALRAGAEDYLVKGTFTPEHLCRTVRFSRERKRVEQGLLQMAHRDPLTGLANRRAIMTQLDRLIRRYGRLCKRFSVLHLDLDGFRHVNDVYGHDAGDALLIEVGHRLRQCMREYDLCARLGGDVFLILVDTTTSMAHLNLAAERLVVALGKPFFIDDQVIQVSASVGVAVFPESGRTPETLLKRADECLFEAKQAGQNRFFIAKEARILDPKGPTLVC